MGKKFRKLAMATMLVLIFGMMGFTVSAKEDVKELDVLFIHDTHSHLTEFATVEDGESQIMGGFAKIKTLINEKKAAV